MDNNTYFAIVNGLNGITYVKHPTSVLVLSGFPTTGTFHTLLPLPMSLIFQIAVIVSLWKLEKWKHRKLGM